MGRFRRDRFSQDPKLSKEKRQFKAARLIVRNLPFKSTEDNVKEHFSQYGKVAEVKLLRKGTKLVGCGFVQFENKINAATAINKSSGKEFLGRIIIVDWAIPKDQFLKSQSHEIKEEIKQEETEEIKKEVISDSDEDNENSVKEVDEICIDKDEDESGSDTISSKSDGSNDSEESDPEEMEEGSCSDDEVEEDSDESRGKEEESAEEESDEDVKPDIKKLKRKWSNDVLEGRTVFIKNVPFMATEEELEKAVEKFGPIFYAKICIDPLTEHSKGTAFVKFKTKEGADACLAAGTDFTINNTVLDPHPAVLKQELKKKQNQPKTPSDSRNLYLLKEGVVMAGSKAAEGVSASDMAKRLQIERWKRQIIKDLGKFVSRYRLVIHNLPPYYDDKKVAGLVKKYCPKTARFSQVRVMRDLKNVDSSGIGKSKGFAFVSFDKHEDALETLRTLNNNPSVFKAQRRPIVSFSVESRKALKVKESRLEKSKQQNQPDKSTPIIKIEKDDKTAKKTGKRNDKKIESTESKKDVQKDIESSENLVKEKFTGAFATAGSKKFLNNLSIKRQALLHRKHLRKEKSKIKQKNKKLPRHIRKAIKAENITRPKKDKNEDKDFTKLVDKYKSQLSSSVKRKKWFD